MNQDPPPSGRFFYSFQLTQHINVRITIKKKIHFMQRIVQLFKPFVFGQVLNSLKLVIFPLLPYELGLDVHIYILL